MTDKDEKVRFTVQMPEDLREDAKRNSERGELSDNIRDLFRRKAYGIGDSESPSELEQAEAELQEVRNSIDDLRLKRSKIDAKIQSKENRETRLEERIDRLKAEQEEVNQSLDVLENMLQNGERMWPVRIKNAVDVDIDTAQELYLKLQDENPELPQEAFEEAGIYEENDWREL